MLNDLTVEQLPLREILTYPRNPRQHSDRQIKLLAKSIQSFGFNVPVLVDRRNKLLAGHARIQAAQMLGLRDVLVLRLEHLSDAQARAFMIADNRLCESSSWDDRLLAEAFKDLSAAGLDFDIEATGFSVGEIDLRIENLESDGGASNEESETPLPDFAQPAISQAGDLWKLGDHRLYWRNALDNVAYERLMQGKRASAGFSDPAYNVRIDGHATGLGNIRHREFAMASGEMNKSEYTAFLTLACTQTRTKQHQWCHSLRLYRLAPCGRASCRWRSKFLRALESVRLVQNKCGHGFALPEPA